MKNKQRTLLVMLALGLAAVSASYSWATNCYKGTTGEDYCRNIITAQGNTVSNEFDVGLGDPPTLSHCLLDTDSTEDDFTAIGLSEILPPGNHDTGWEWDSLLTACAIQYSCDNGFGDQKFLYDPTGSFYSGPFGVLSQDPASICPRHN